MTTGLGVPSHEGVLLAGCCCRIVVADVFSTL